MKMHRSPTLDTPRVVSVSSGGLTVRNDIQSCTRSELDSIHANYIAFFKSTAMHVPFDEVYSMRVLQRCYKDRNVIGIIRDGNEVVGAIVANVSPHSLSETRVLQQSFFHTSAKGKKLLSAIVAAFNFLVEYAKVIDVACVFAASGTWDTKHALNRILSKNGWTTEGYLSVYNIKEK